MIKITKQNQKYWIVGGVAAVLLIIFLAVGYNKLVGLQEDIKQKWNDLQSTYQRRADLVPSIVAVVKGNAAFEQETLRQIAEARSRTGGVYTDKQITAENYNDQLNKQNELSKGINNLIISVERYPNLKATRAFSDLQLQLEKTEYRIVVARRDFNEAVAKYNKKVRGFPSSMTAALFGFKKKDGFTADPGSETSKPVQFNQ